MRPCSNCGFQITEEDFFCPFCGMKQEFPELTDMAYAAPESRNDGSPVFEADGNMEWIPEDYDEEMPADGIYTDEDLDDMDYLDDPDGLDDLDLLAAEGDFIDPVYSGHPFIPRRRDSSRPEPRVNREPRKAQAVEAPQPKKGFTPARIALLVAVFGVIAALAVYMANSVMDVLDQFRTEREQHVSVEIKEKPETEGEHHVYVTGVDIRGLMLRSEIGESGGDIVAMLPAGAEVVVLDENESAFSYVYYALTDISGYAKKWNLTESADAVCGYSIYFAGDDGAMLYYSADSDEVMDTLAAGESVQVIAKNQTSRWLVLTNESYVYVNPSELVEEATVEEDLIGAGPLPADGYEIYYVDGVNYYLALRTDGVYNQDNEIGAMHNEDAVYVLRKSGNNESETNFWYVYSPDLGMYGYCNSNYLIQ